MIKNKINIEKVFAFPYVSYLTALCGELQWHIKVGP